MIKLISKGQSNSTEIKTVIKDMILNPSKGEQFFINNSEGLKYKINLINNEKSIEIVLETNPQLKIIFKNFVDVISDSDDKKSVICLLNTKEGLEEFNKANLSFKDEELIENLKKLLSSSSIKGNAKDGIVIDDFKSLTDSMQATAAGAEIKSDSSIFKSYEFNDENESNIVAGRTRLQEIETGERQASIDIDDDRRKVIFDNTKKEDVVRATLSATASTSEDRGSIVYTVNLVNGYGIEVVAKEDIVIILENGEIIKIKLGESSGTVITTVNRDDVYKEIDSISNSIKSIISEDVISIDNVIVSTMITDDVDVVKAILSATPSVSEDGGNIIYTVDLVDEYGKKVVAKEDIVITLENGEIIIIKPGESTGTVITVVDRDDIYKDIDSVSNSIKTLDGGDEFEKLEVDDSVVSTTIIDDMDNINIKLIEKSVEKVVYTPLHGVEDKEAGELQIVGLKDGGYVITWDKYSNFDSSIFVQRFDSAGNKIGTIVQLEALDYNNGYDYEPKITNLSDGGYVIAWHGSSNEGDKTIFI